MDEQTIPESEEDVPGWRSRWQNHVWPATLSLAVTAVLYLILPILPESALINIGRSLIILIGGILPSIMYRYFTEERLPTFHREYKQNLRRLGLPQNAKQYQEKFEAVYGPTTTIGSRIAPFNSPVFITTILTFIGWTLVFFPTTLEQSTLFPNPNPFAYGFLGAYIFSIGSLVRQFVTNDLQPRYYASLTVRFVTVFVLSWMVRLILPNTLNGSDLLVAFFIGIFPTTGLRVIQRIVTNILSIVSKGFDETLPLSELDGLNAYHEDRLLIEGIENVQNLASANIVDLMLRTRFPVEQIIDWMDQALLKMHTRDRFEEFRRCSLRTATDFMDAYEARSLADEATRSDWQQQLAALLDKNNDLTSANTTTLIETMHYTLQSDPNLFQIRYWRDHEFEVLPEDIEYQRTKADLKLMQNLPDEAVPIYDRLIQKFDDSYLLYLYRGLAHAANNDYSKAIDDYEQIINSNRVTSEAKQQAYLYRFRAHLALDEEDRYSEAVNQFLQAFPDGINNFPEAQMDLAVAQLTYMGEFIAAIHNLDAVIKSNFNVPEAYANRGLARYQYTRANPNLDEHQKQESLKQARADLEYALRLKPSLIPFYINLAIILGEWGELEEQERVLTAALAQLRLKPDQDYAYRVRLERGYLFSKQERFEEAAADFEAAIRLSPAQPTAYFFYGTALSQLHRLAEATVAFQRAIILDPTLKEAQQKLGDALLAQGSYEQAERAYVTLLQLTRETADNSAETRVHLGLGQVYRHLQRPIDAERELRSAINLAGDDEAETVSRAEFELGMVKLDVGDTAAAALQFVNSAVLFEVYGDARASANAYHYLAQTFIEQSQFDEAHDALKTAQQRLSTVFIPGNADDQTLQESIQQELTHLATLQEQAQRISE